MHILSVGSPVPEGARDRDRQRDVVVGVFGIPYLHAFVHEGERERGGEEGRALVRRPGKRANSPGKNLWRGWSGMAAGLPGRTVALVGELELRRNIGSASVLGRRVSFYFRLKRGRGEVFGVTVLSGEIFSASLSERQNSNEYM